MRLWIRRRWTLRPIPGFLALLGSLVAAFAGGCRAAEDPLGRAGSPPAPPATAVPAVDGAADLSPPPPIGSVRVLLRDPSGPPIPGARVVVLPPEIPRFGSRPGTVAPDPLAEWNALPPAWDLEPVAAAVTGTDGGATVPSLPMGDGEAVVETPGRVRRSAPFRLAPDRTTADVEILAEEGHPFEGRVLTAAGAPIAGAVVTAEYPPFAPGGRCEGGRYDFARVRTGDEGVFRFDALPATVVILQCGPPGAWSAHRWPVRVPAVASIDLRIAGRGPVEGVLRGGPDGAPLPGADLLFTTTGWHRAPVAARATTDAGGRYRIPLYPANYVNGITLAAPGWWEEPRVFGPRQVPLPFPEEGPARLDLEALPDSPGTAAIRGIVRGPEGPVQGATVFLHAPEDDAPRVPSRWTDAGGRFWFPVAPSGWTAVLVEGAPGLFQPGTGDIFGNECPPPDPGAPWAIPAGAPRPVDIDIPLSIGGRVLGRVIDGAGKPVAGAKVGTRGGVWTHSRADGTFLLTGLDEPCEADVWARSEDGLLMGRSARFRAGAGEDAEGVEVILLPASGEGRRRIRISGRAHPAVPPGSPAPTVPVGDGHAACEGAWVPLDASGGFHLEVDCGRGRRSVPLWLDIPGWGAAGIDVPLPAGDGTVDAGEIPVPRNGRIRGRIEDGEGPLAGVPIAVERKREFSAIGCSPDEDPQPTIEAVTGRDGVFETAGLAAGTWIARVAAPGFMAEEREVVVRDGGSFSRCDVRLSRAARLRGRVRRPEGSPVAGAEVAATPSGEGGKADPGREERTWTDEDGGFSLMVREDSAHVLEISPGYEPAERFRPATSGPHRPGEEPVSVVVEDGPAIAGRIVDADGHPVRWATVTCSGASDGADGDPTADIEVLTAGDGTFRFVALGEGACDLSVEAGLEEPLVVEGVPTGGPEVEICLPPAFAIEGILLDEGGKPAPRRVVMATPLGGGSGTRRWVDGETDGSGRFRLVGVGSGACRIELGRGRVGVRLDGAPGPTGRTWPLVGGAGVEPGSTGVVLRIPSASMTAISGRVVDDGGGPFTGFVVEIPIRPGESTLHAGDAAGAAFGVRGLRLDEECEMTAWFAGLGWGLSVPAGTGDLVLTAGPAGLHAGGLGGRRITTAPARGDLRTAQGEALYPAGIRLVSPGSGAIVPATPGDGSTFEVPDLPVGPWRVEVQGGARGPWRPTRAGFMRGSVVLLAEE